MFFDDSCCIRGCLHELCTIICDLERAANLCYHTEKWNAGTKWNLWVLFGNSEELVPNPTDVCSDANSWKNRIRGWGVVSRSTNKLTDKRHVVTTGSETSGCCDCLTSCVSRWLPVSVVSSTFTKTDWQHQIRFSFSQRWPFCRQLLKCLSCFISISITLLQWTFAFNAWNCKQKQNLFPKLQTPVRTLQFRTLFVGCAPLWGALSQITHCCLYSAEEITFLAVASSLSSSSTFFLKWQTDSRDSQDVITHKSNHSANAVR